jgi:thioredoxin reductase
MHRRTVLIGVFAGVGLVCASTLSTAQNDVNEGEGHGGQFTVTDRDGNTPSAGPPLTERQREQRRQDETPEQFRKRIDYVDRLQRKYSSGD